MPPPRLDPPELPVWRQAPLPVASCDAPDHSTPARLGISSTTKTRGPHGFTRDRPFALLEPALIATLRLNATSMPRVNPAKNGLNALLGCRTSRPFR